MREGAFGVVLDQIEGASIRSCGVVHPSEPTKQVGSGGMEEAMSARSRRDAPSVDRVEACLRARNLGDRNGAIEGNDR
ncbi:MAG: hypothetical protein R2843_13920 [Thermomicrobiales bacterium]